MFTFFGRKGMITLAAQTFILFLSANKLDLRLCTQTCSKGSRFTEASFANSVEFDNVFGNGNNIENISKGLSRKGAVQRGNNDNLARIGHGIGKGCYIGKLAKKTKWLLSATHKRRGREKRGKKRDTHKLSFVNTNDGAKFDLCLEFDIVHQVISDICGAM